MKNSGMDPGKMSCFDCSSFSMFKFRGGGGGFKVANPIFLSRTFYKKLSSAPPPPFQTKYYIGKPHLYMYRAANPPPPFSKKNPDQHMLPLEFDATSQESRVQGGWHFWLVYSKVHVYLKD